MLLMGCPGHQHGCVTARPAFDCSLDCSTICHSIACTSEIQTVAVSKFHRAAVYLIRQPGRDTTLDQLNLKKKNHKP